MGCWLSWKQAQPATLATYLRVRGYQDQHVEWPDTPAEWRCDGLLLLGTAPQPLAHRPERRSLAASRSDTRAAKAAASLLCAMPSFASIFET